MIIARASHLNVRVVCMVPRAEAHCREVGVRRELAERIETLQEALQSVARWTSQDEELSELYSC